MKSPLPPVLYHTQNETYPIEVQRAEIEFRGKPIEYLEGYVKAVEERGAGFLLDVVSNILFNDDNATRYYAARRVLERKREERRLSSKEVVPR